MALQIAAEELQYIAPTELVARPQVRQHFDEAELDGLAASLREVGMLQPIRACKDGDSLVIVDGERRRRAAIIAEMKSIPVIVEQQSLDEAGTVQRQLIANVQHADLSPLERALAIHRLMEESGWSAAEAAARLGQSPGAVSKLLALLTLPQRIVELIEAGKITASAGYELSRVKDEARQAELAAQLTNGRLTRDAVAGVTKAAKKRPAKGAENQPARVTAILGESRSVTVASAGLTLERFIELIEELLSKARRVRSQGVELATFIKMLKDQARAG